MYRILKFLLQTHYIYISMNNIIKWLFDASCNIDWNNIQLLSDIYSWSTLPKKKAERGEKHSPLFDRLPCVSCFSEILIWLAMEKLNMKSSSKSWIILFLENNHLIIESKLKIIKIWIKYIGKVIILKLTFLKIVFPLIWPISSNQGKIILIHLAVNV